MIRMGCILPFNLGANPRRRGGERLTGKEQKSLNHRHYGAGGKEAHYGEKGGGDGGAGDSQKPLRARVKGNCSERFLGDDPPQETSGKERGKKNCSKKTSLQGGQVSFTLHVVGEKSREQKLHSKEFSSSHAQELITMSYKLESSGVDQVMCKGRCYVFNHEKPLTPQDQKRSDWRRWSISRFQEWAPGVE